MCSLIIEITVPDLIEAFRTEAGSYTCCVGLYNYIAIVSAMREFKDD